MQEKRDQELELWRNLCAARRDKSEPKEEVLRRENMQNGVSDEVVTAGCPWKAQTVCLDSTS